MQEETRNMFLPVPFRQCKESGEFTDEISFTTAFVDPCWDRAFYSACAECEFAFYGGLPQAAAATSSPAAHGADFTATVPGGRDAGRQVLPTNDGWALAEGGTTGGA